MSVIRQSNILGQQRIDVPHLRALESGTAGDFDLLAGRMLAGEQPLVISGFTLNAQSVTHASQLAMRVAGSMMVHFLASESGSIFSVPDDRADESLKPTNSRVQGQFSPSQTNYVGIDLVRVVDESTADLAMFLNATTLIETPKEVPLARTLDYRIVISTVDFSSLPGVCPIAKVRTDGDNNIVSITDARSMFFRLGAGGTTPNPLYAFPWPGGRREADVEEGDDIFAGADKNIGSLKGWADAVMTRLWEIGGGEFWFSPTADRNVRMVHVGEPFESSGEYFEWDESNLHWQGLKVIFDNSTGYVNTVVDITTDTPNLTDLADGECIYVDLNRTGNVTLTAKKAVLNTLGAGSPPGSRIVLAWRHGDQVFTRDQGYSVNSSFKLATIAAAGTVRLSASDPGTADLGVHVATIESESNSFKAIAGGLTRGSGDFIGDIGPVTIGGSLLDRDIEVITWRAEDATYIVGVGEWATTGRAVLEVSNESAVLDVQNRIALFKAFNSDTFTTETALTIESIGAIGHRVVVANPEPPDPTASDPIRIKTFFRTNGDTTPNIRDQFCIMWHDGSIVVVAEGPKY